MCTTLNIKSTKVSERADDIPDKIKNLVDCGDKTQVIINKYEPGQGIGAHIDSSVFKDKIIIISLSSDICMKLTRGNEIINLYLPKRSILTLSDESGYLWKHEIVKRKKDKNCYDIINDEYVDVIREYQ